MKVLILIHLPYRQMQIYFNNGVCIHRGLSESDGSLREWIVIVTDVRIIRVYSFLGEGVKLCCLSAISAFRLGKV